MTVPFLDLKTEYPKEVKQAILDSIDSLIDSTQFILGKPVESLEKEIAKYCNAKYAIGVSSGTDALIASLMAAKIGPGDEVITSPFTFSNPGLNLSE